MTKYVRVVMIGCVLCGLALTLVGCASILGGGTRQDVQISSSPSQARVKVERTGAAGKATTVWEGATPSTVNLRRKHEYLVTVSLEGHRPAEVLLEHGTNGWVWGNLLCGGILGLIIDFTNGAAKKLQPNEVNVQLLTAMGPESTKSVYAVFRTLDANGDLRVLPVPLIPEGDYLTLR